MNNSIAGTNDAIDNRRKSIRVDMGIAIFFLSIMEKQMKLLTHSAICDFVTE